MIAQYGTNKKIGICFAYYDFKKPDLGDPPKIISALIKQLCRKLSFIPQDLLSFKQNSLRPSFASLQQLFISVSKSFEEIFLLVDALDECPSDQRHQIIGFFNYVVGSVSTVKIFITSRKEGDIAEAFEQNSTPVIRIEAQNVTEDIKKFLEDEVKRLRTGHHGKRLYLQDHSLEGIIISTLSDNADGMLVAYPFSHVIRVLTYLMKVSLGPTSAGEFANHKQVTQRPRRPKCPQNRP